MADIKLTKTELRVQQVKLDQLKKYLPTLRLKKALLQVEVNHAQLAIDSLIQQMQLVEERVKAYSLLFSDRSATELLSSVKIKEVVKSYENIAGLDIPSFESITFEEPQYNLFDTPVWLEAAIAGVKELLTVREKIMLAQEKKKLLQRELREVSIRVNLFEKILIPRSIGNIKKIKIFLGDQQLAAVSQAKMSKKKIMQRNEEV